MLHARCCFYRKTDASSITDSRLGIFLGNKVYVSMEEDGIQKYSVATAGG
ncbi:MAG: hypothetical protein ACLU4J_17805 [Butyricimonas paravirosa]